MLVIPYLNCNNLLIYILLYLYTINNIKIPKEYNINILSVLLLALISSLGTNSLTINNYLSYKELITLSININIPNFIVQILSFKTLIQYHYILIFPKFIFRSILIVILYSNIIKILLLTTLYENIILYYLVIYSNSKHNIPKQVNFILILSYQFVVILINKIYLIKIAIKLRSINNIFNMKQYSLCFYAMKNLLIFIEREIYIIASILYTREIKYKNTRFVDIN